MSFTRPTRRQLARLANDDTEVIKALEGVFDAAGETIPANVTTAQTAADAAQVDATQGISDAAAAQADATQAIADAAAAQAAADAAQADVDAIGGASGSFTTVDSKTVTVVGGLITSIV